MSCAGRNHLAKRSEATRDFTDTNWDGTLAEGEVLAIVESDCGGGALRVHNLNPEGAAPSSSDEPPLLVNLPGKFHKLIWFLRGDILTHADGCVVRKVSEEQLRRLAKEQPDSLWAVADTLHSARQEKRKEHKSVEELVAANPNRATIANRRATGFTSSDEDDDSNDEEVAEEEEEESAGAHGGDHRADHGGDHEEK